MNLTAEKGMRGVDAGGLPRTALRLVAVLTLGSLLSACGSNSLEDLRQYTQKVLAQVLQRVAAE